jgi:osmotically-inducible protein OsmY
MKNQRALRLMIAVGLAASVLGCGAGCSRQASSEAILGSLPSTQDDGDVPTRVHTALLRDPQLSGLGIAVAGINGDMHISGYARSQIQIDRAEAVARETPGVYRIHNELALRP